MLRPVQVIIGRSTGEDQEPLGAATWGDFQAAIITYLASDGEYYRTISGLGVDTKGRMEENATILGSVEELDFFRALLSRLRVTYGQAVILLIVGDLDVIA